MIMNKRVKLVFVYGDENANQAASINIQDLWKSVNNYSFFGDTIINNSFIPKDVVANRGEDLCFPN